MWLLILRFPRYAFPPPWWHQLLCFHTLAFFSEVLLGFLILVTQGQCLRRQDQLWAQILNEEQQFPELQWISSWRVDVNPFEKKASFAQAIVLFVWLCQALSYLSSQPWQGLSWNAVSVQKEKSWSKWEDLEEYRISTSTGLLEQIIQVFVKSVSYDLSGLGEEDRLNPLFHGYFIQLWGITCPSFSLLCTGTGKLPDENFPGQGCKQTCTGHKGLTKGRHWPLFPPKLNKPQLSTSKLYTRARHAFSWSFMVFAMLETPILSTLVDLQQGKIIRKKKAARIVEHK